MFPRETPPGELMNSQFLRLLSGVSVHGDQHLAEVERDLVQMDVLLDEAIKKLCASFMAIHDAVSLQQETLNSMLADGTPAADHAARFAAIHGEINRHVGAAVTGLQFQDMTSQLIRRMVLHLAGLREVFGALDAGEAGSEDMLALLSHINERVGEQSSEVVGVVRSAVNQRHMESGDIELF